MDTLLQDLRFAVRTLAKKPGFTLVAILTLALGIGANAAIFSLVNALLFKGVPGLADTDGIVEISRDLDGAYFDMSYPVFTSLRTENDVLEDMVAQVATPVAVGTGDNPSVHLSLAVTGNYFSTLGVQPDRGRYWHRDESFYPSVTQTVVISDYLWTTKFEAREDIIGQTIRVNGYPLEIIGVTPPGFAGHVAAARMDVYLPIGLEIPGLPKPSTLDHFGSGITEVFGRLKDGTTVAQAQAALTTMADRLNLEQSAEAEPGGYQVRVAPWAPLPSSIRLAATVFFTVLMVVVGLAMTMACVNVSSMLLARATERDREIAVRRALGAGRGRLIRQLLTESLVLFALAGAAGLFVASWATTALIRFLPPLPPGIRIDLDLGLDLRVVGFAFVVTFAAGVVFSLAPALHSTRADFVPALKEGGWSGGTRRSRLRGTMVGVQMAVTMLLMIVAGLFTRSLRQMKELDPGWRVEDVHVMSLDLELNGTADANGKIFYRELTERVRALPGVHASAIAAKLPLAGRSSMGQINVEGVQAPDGQLGFDAFYNRISHGYFDALRIPLLQGRDVRDSDREGDPRVAVINRAMAQRFWPDGDAVGHEFWTGRTGEGRAYQVIGVVENAKYRRLVEETPNFYYVPYQQLYNAQMTLHVLAEPGAGPTVATAVPNVVREIAPGLPRLPFRQLEQEMQLFFLPQRMAAWVAGLMGVFGLILGAVGVYGVTAFTVGQRTREIGVRLALGARPVDITRSMVGRGMIAPVVGMGVGVAVALAITRFMTSVLAGVSATDPLAFGGVIAALGGVALIATLVPVHRASQVDPATTLRSD